jgi:hypothetical protein
MVVVLVVAAACFRRSGGAIQFAGNRRSSLVVTYNFCFHPYTHVIL